MGSSENESETSGRTAGARVFSASADSSSRNPQDWGRAAAQLFQHLAEQASNAGGGPIEENMVDADVRLHVLGRCGHVPAVEHPQEFRRLLSYFLTE